METLITNEIKITVEVTYQHEHSHPLNNKYLFAYQIGIENLSKHTVQLLRRHWFIFDSCLRFDEVKGDGVIGKQPVLRPGELHTYKSWCPLATAIGTMHGYYTMRRVDDGTHFKVNIPKFQLIPNFKLN